MEFILWLVFAMGFAWCVLNPFKVLNFVMGMGKKAFPSYHAEPSKTPVQDFTGWERLVAEGRKYKAQQHTEWLEEAWAILRRDCEHVYHHQKWYTCMKCGYEEPWVWEPNCGCTVDISTTLTDETERYILRTRQSWCSVHGTDYRLFPLSDRKQGPFGPSGNVDSREAVRRSKELLGYTVKKIDFPTK